MKQYPRTPWRIGIDQAATVGQATGLGAYVSSLTQAIHDVHDSRFQIKRINRVQNNLRTPTRVLWDQVGLPLTAQLTGIDLLFVAAFSAPLHFQNGRPTVMVAHDIYGVLFPQQFSPVARWYWSRLLPYSMQQADHLIAISQHTKQDLIDRLQIDPQRITVISPAAADCFGLRPQTWIDQQLQSLNINSNHPFLISVGTVEPRKNFARLIRAFSRLRDPDARLYMIGKSGWSTDDVQDALRQVGHRVRWLQYVKTDQLIALYNSCQGVILPSLYEGFGLPALEALACGATVAVANNSSLPEVVGSVGYLFDPTDESAITDACAALLQAGRTDLSTQRSLDRATQFTWSSTAKRTLGVLEQFL